MSDGSTITDGTSTWTPELVDGYTTTRTSRNVVHEIVGSNAPAVTLRSAAYRSGNLRALFLTESAATGCRDGLSAAKSFTFSNSSYASIGMKFVVTSLRLEFNSSRKTWIVAFDYQEIS